MNSGGSNSMPIGNEEIGEEDYDKQLQSKLREEYYDKQLKLQIDEKVNQILKLQLEKYELQRQIDRRRDKFHQTRERFVLQIGNTMSENSDDNTTGTGQRGCAVCAYQNKECLPDCIFASCFPPELHHVFLIAHCLFGMDRVVEFLTTPGDSGPHPDLKLLTLDENLRLSLELHRELRRRNREINEKMLQIGKVKSMDLNVIHGLKMESTISKKLFLNLLSEFFAYHA